MDWIPHLHPKASWQLIVLSLAYPVRVIEKCQCSIAGNAECSLKECVSEHIPGYFVSGSYT